MAIPDFLTLKYAIYFIVPACVLYFAALIGGGLLSIATRLVAKVDVSDDMARTIMAFVIGVTAAIVLLAVWLGASAWVALAAGSASAFLVGTCAYSQAIERPAKGSEKPKTAPIGLRKASVVSAVVTFAGAAVPFVVLLARRLAR